MANWEVSDDAWRSQLNALDDATCRRIQRTMVENAAKVLIKEMRGIIQEHHHVVSHDMENSVAMGDVREDIDSTSVEVWPQGDDRRGVSNEMKAKFINYGYYNIVTGKKERKTDHFLNAAFRKRCEPRIRAVMNATFAICMEELNNTGG